METKNELPAFPALSRQREEDVTRTRLDNSVIVTTAYAYYNVDVYMDGHWYYVDWKQPVSNAPRQGHRAFTAHGRTRDKVVYVDTDTRRILNTAYMLAEIVRDRGGDFISDVYGHGRGEVTVKPDGTIVPPRRNCSENYV